MKRYLILSLTILTLVILASGCTSTDVNQTGNETGGFKLTSSAFTQGKAIPQKYTADGEDISPPLSWTSAPDDTKSFTIICEDPDAPGGTFIHWIVFNIPGNATELPEGITNQETLDNGAIQGINDFNSIGYGGPAPPTGETHRYAFKIYALDIELNLESGSTIQQVNTAMEGHILAQAQLTGRYGR
ncbi:MAG: YbhB/YbcL family Raf kinase inhibitor-like protein [Methanomicrobiales archaeon]